MDRHSAGAQGLGYLYQPRFALLRTLQLPEDTAILIEKDDDLDFTALDGGKVLASLKHKAEGDRLTDRSEDFWKSVIIWQKRYTQYGRLQSELKFLLFTTSEISPDSVLARFQQSIAIPEDDRLRWTSEIIGILETSKSKVCKKALSAFSDYTPQDLYDFCSRILVVSDSPRIDEVKQEILANHMKGVHRAHREAVLERLESWWNDNLIEILRNATHDPIWGHEVSDKLATLADEYSSDNLPIEFLGATPASDIDIDNDNRLFVIQLRYLGVNSNQIQRAIIDYYRAFEQRSSWIRGNLLVLGELEAYEARLVDEWERFRDHLFDELDDTAAEDHCVRAGKELFKWANLQGGSLASLRIRERVTEPYVSRGGFHILANERPAPRVYWHPRFLSRLSTILGVAA